MFQAVLHNYSLASQRTWWWLYGMRYQKKTSPPPSPGTAQPQAAPHLTPSHPSSTLLGHPRCSQCLLPPLAPSALSVQCTSVHAVDRRAPCGCVTSRRGKFYL